MKVWARIQLHGCKLSPRNFLVAPTEEIWTPQLLANCWYADGKLRRTSPRRCVFMLLIVGVVKKKETTNHHHRKPGEMGKVMGFFTDGQCEPLWPSKEIAWKGGSHLSYLYFISLPSLFFVLVFFFLLSCACVKRRVTWRNAAGTTEKGPSLFKPFFFPGREQKTGVDLKTTVKEK